MSFTSVNADLVAAAATHLENIGASISGANATAAALTTELVPAAQDEISAAIAGLFGTCARDFYGVAAQAAAFHDRFVQAVSASAGSYVAAEGANAAALVQTAQQNLVGAINAPAEALLGHPLIATGTLTAAQTIVDAAGPVPENAYPFGTVKQLSFTASTDNGLQILDATIKQTLSQTTDPPILVYGYSQSAVVASLEMSQLQAEGVSPSLVNFYIVGNPMNPNGGFFERFAGLQFQSIGLDFYGATPANPYPTTMVTIEYDSWADFPRYPLDILSDVNAITSLNHFYYHVLTTQQLNSAIVLPTSGPSATTYLMIPATNLPLLNPIRGIPFIGNPIADLLQPDLTYLVNLGYGDPLYGWSTSPANVPTPAGLFPPLSAFQELPGLLQSGAQLGVQNFIGDFTGTGPNPVTLPTLSSLASLLEHPSSSLTSLLGPLLGTTSGASAATGSATGLSALIANPLALAPGLSALIANPGPATLGTVVTNFANNVSGVASDVYTLAYPTADILTAAVISVPSYDVTLFLDGLLQAVNGQPVQGLMNAIGQPIASDIALYLWLANLEAAVLANPTEAAGPATGVPAIGIN